MSAFPESRLSPPQSRQAGSSPVPGVRGHFGHFPRRVPPLLVPPVCRAHCRLPARHRTAVCRRKKFPVLHLRRATRLPAPRIFAGLVRSAFEVAPILLLTWMYSRQPHYLLASFWTTAREILP